MEVGLPYSKRHLEMNDMVEDIEVAAINKEGAIIFRVDVAREDKKEEEGGSNDEGAMVVPANGHGHGHGYGYGENSNTPLNKVPGEQRSTAENLLLQKLASEKKKKARVAERERLRQRELERVEKEKGQGAVLAPKGIKRRKRVQQQTRQNALATTTRQRIEV